MGFDMKSSLIGPFVISLLLCFVFVDYLSFLQGNRSFLKGIWSLLGVVATDLLGWPSFLSNSVFVIWGGIAIAGLALIWFVLRSAKKAMSNATDETSGPPTDKD